MTKDAYYQMCEELSIEPVPEDIPLDINDFPELVQNCLLVYSKLKDIWDTMGGKYMGKDYNIVFDLFNLYSIEDQDEKILAMDLMQIIDNTRMKLSSNKVVAENAKIKKPR